MVEQSKQPQMAVAEAIYLLQTFRGADLTQTIYEIEKSLKGVAAQNYSAVLTTRGAKAEVLGAAGLIKQLAGQINVVVHALGILLCLPHILRPGEVIDYVSLGAGNTGRAFDLETSLRIAEFKLIVGHQPTRHYHHEASTLYDSDDKRFRIRVYNLGMMAFRKWASSRLTFCVALRHLGTEREI